MSKHKKQRLDKKMIEEATSILPYDVIYLITKHLNIHDLCILNQVCRCFYLFFATYFAKIKKLDEDFLTSKSWPSLKKYAAIESRTKIFPEARYFFDLTHLLMRCLEQGDIFHYNYFWQEVIRAEKKDLFKKPISYLLLIEKSFQCRSDQKVLESLFSRLYLCDEDFLRFIYRLMAVRSGYHRHDTLAKFVSKYVAEEWRVDLDLSTFRRPDDPTLIQSHLKTIDQKYLPFVDAILTNDNQTLVTLLKARHGFDEDFNETFAITAALCGRKDLYVYLRSYLGYMPSYHLTQTILTDLDCREMIEWISKNSYPGSNP